MKKFENHPLITPELINELGQAVFENDFPWPAWVKHPAFVNIDPDEMPDAKNIKAIIFVETKSTDLKITLNLFCLAATIEITRFGHSLSVASNGKKPPSRYAKVSFKDAQGDRVSLRRILANARMDEQVSGLWSDDDYSPEDADFSHSTNPVKAARQIAMEHVERLARKREQEGSLPANFDVAAYLGNLWRLFFEIDKMAKENPFRVAAE